MNPKAKPNYLIHSTSPYLLQHAYNPVDWHPWGPDALSKAKEEDKPIILSIGYSSCHWCHVMERESFESDEVAEIMNQHFVCIKVDREERPDIDQVYMDAVQAMGIHGGWPLNVFLTPDQKPFYGGTYFPQASWKKILLNVSDTYRNSKTEVRESAEKLSAYIAQSDTEKFDLHPDKSLYSSEDLKTSVGKLAEKFDTLHGGFSRAPKFPMPVFWEFLLNYALTVKDQTVQSHVLFTLIKIAKGGIFDQLGGGFARYSVDEKWFAPHFEKMLYDNAQLLSLYSIAYRLNPDPLFREVVYLTHEFISREMTHAGGGFYSALDADSEGKEGNYYVWENEEMDKHLPENLRFLKAFWGVIPEGNWEEGKNILTVAIPEKTAKEKNNFGETEFVKSIEQARRILMREREKRPRPALDNKMLSGWNAMMISGLVNAYITFNDNRFLEPALKNADLMARWINEQGEIPRSFHDNSAFPRGYLDDYAFVISALILLYHATYDEKWITLAGRLAATVIRDFSDKEDDMFYYSGIRAENLIARKKEIFDNVIPGSNSVMAINFFRLGHLLDKKEYIEYAQKMMNRVKRFLLSEPEYLPNWGNLYCMQLRPLAEIVVIGSDYKKYGQELERHFHPAKIVMASRNESELPLFKNRTAIDGRTTIYVCYNKTCMLPVHSIEEALHLLQ